VLAAARKGDEPGQRALDELCQQYWSPVYAFLRRHGRSPHDAQDLTQGFFSQLLPRDWLAEVGPEKGRFRSFLLACLRNYLGHVHAHENSSTRHPGHSFLSLDANNFEGSYSPSIAESFDPAALFERRWAYVLIENALQSLRSAYATEGRATLFDVLSEHLVGEAERGRYAETAEKLGLSEGAARVAVSRLRERFRERLRAEVGRTVEDPREVDEEIRRLVAVARL